MAKKTTTTLIIFITLSLFISLALAYHYFKLSKTQNCINDFLNDAGISNIKIKPYYQGQKPMLEGLVTHDEKYKITQGLAKHCGISDFFDYLDIKVVKENRLTWIRFIVDNFNSRLDVHGLVKNKTQLNRILNSFKITNLATIANDIEVNSGVLANDFSVILSLLIPAINRVKLQDVMITKDSITIKGLVRNQFIEKEIIQNLQQIFADDIKIINQLELVEKIKSNTPKLEIEPIKPDFL